MHFDHQDQRSVRRRIPVRFARVEPVWTVAIRPRAGTFGQRWPSGTPYPASMHPGGAVVSPHLIRVPKMDPNGGSTFPCSQGGA